jgi:hypothetical protein
MYICEICGRLYDGDFGTHYEHHGHSSYYAEEVDNDAVCGTCGGEYVEATKCAVCGEWFYDEENLGVCECCLDNAKTYENACKIWADDTNSVEVKPILNCVFGERKINEILFAYLEANLADYEKEIKDYINENIDYLADILKERKENENGRNTN